MKALSTLVKGLGKVTEPTTTYMWLKAIIESAEAELEELRPAIEQCQGEYICPELHKKMTVSDSSKITVRADVVKELTEQELIQTWTPTQKALSGLGIRGKQLIAEYGEKVLIKSIRVTNTK